MNDYYWSEMSDDFKKGYVWALHHGLLNFTEAYSIELRLRGITEKNVIDEIVEYLAKEKFYYWGISIKQKKDGIDELYKDSANKKIPVHRLLSFVCKSASGEISTDRLEIELQELREEYANR